MVQSHQLKGSSDVPQHNEQNTLQTEAANGTTAISQGIQPTYPTWPTSKPGPLTTSPLPGMKPINAIRREQVAEIGYNQETGEPGTQSPFRSMPDASITGSTSFDQEETAQEALKRRKHRL